MFTIFPLFNFQFPYLSLLYHDDLVQLYPWCLRAGSLGTRLRFACQEFFGSALGNITCEEWKKQDWAEGFELRCLCNRGFSWSYSVCRRAGMSPLSHLGIRWLSFFLRNPFHWSVIKCQKSLEVGTRQLFSVKGDSWRVIQLRAVGVPCSQLGAWVSQSRRGNLGGTAQHPRPLVKASSPPPPGLQLSSWWRLKETWNQAE